MTLFTIYFQVFDILNFRCAGWHKYVLNESVNIVEKLWEV